MANRQLCNDCKQYMNIDFGDAIDALKRGYAMARADWHAKGMYIKLQVPDASSKMTLPYIYMRTVQGDLVPWLASQTDMLANDWWCVDEGKLWQREPRA